MQDFKAVVDATGQSVESKKMRGWRVALAKQAGISVDYLAVVKIDKQPRAQRGGGSGTVVLTYEFRVKASEPCVGSARVGGLIKLVLRLIVSFAQPEVMCGCVSGGCSASCCGRCSFTTLRCAARGRRFFPTRG